MGEDHKIIAKYGYTGHTGFNGKRYPPERAAGRSQHQLRIMLSIQYASDLHLEFAENSRYLEEHPLQVTGDVLVLAGDVCYLGNNCARHPFWDWAADNYQQVVVVAGNHEFYDGFDMDGLHDGWTYKIRPNVAYHYNDVIRIGDADLILTTLWSHIRIEDSGATQMRVNDFRRIRCGDKPLDWVRFNEEHHRCFHFLNDRVKSSMAKHVVVATHHLPSFSLLPPEFKGSNINGAFVVDLDGFIAANEVDYWIYGHSHRNIDAQIGATRCVSNQLGYVRADEHFNINAAKAIIL